MTGLDASTQRAAPQAGGSTPPAAVLAIDGGNSKTDVALVAADGTLLARSRGPGASPQHLGVDASMDALDRLVGEAAAAAGLRAGVGPLAEQTAACLAGADLPVEEERLRAAVHARGWGRRTEVANDTFALLRAGATVPWGVAVVCGAGINCVGVAPDGAVARFPALGRISGDWGGGHELGEEALWWAVRAEDGRGPATVLRELVPAHFGMQRPHEVTEALHFDVLPRRRLDELAPVLLHAAETGDQVAREVVDRLADEITLMATVALRRLDLLGTRTDVVLGGGVLAARNPLLLEEVTARLAERAPKAVPQVTSLPPVVGAALLGLDRLGRTPDAEPRLRTAFTAT